VGYFAASGDPTGIAQAVFGLLLAGYFPIGLVVAGTVPLGEETALGVRAWHLTLPVSLRAQWTIKLAVTVAVATAAVLLLPWALTWVAAGIVPSPGYVVRWPRSAGVLMLFTGGLVVSFWAATLVGHSVRAAVVTGVALLALVLCLPAATWAARHVTAATDVLTWIMVQHQLPPDAFRPYRFLSRWWTGLPVVAALTVVGLGQSLRAFGRDETGGRRLARSAAILTVAVFSVAFAHAAYLEAAARQQRSAPVLELEDALKRLSASRLAASAPVPGDVSVADLHGMGALSDTTARWLSRSAISLSARERRHGAETVVWVVARVTFPNGGEFGFVYRVPASAPTDAPRATKA
jgi:hypothetical protein